NGRRVDPNAEIRTDGAPRGTGAYSQAVRAGDFVFISGQGPLDPATLEVRGATIEEQTEHTLRNLAPVAAAAGGSPADGDKPPASRSRSWVKPKSWPTPGSTTS